jgi:hypothetical protein
LLDQEGADLIDRCRSPGYQPGTDAMQRLEIELVLRTWNTSFPMSIPIDAIAGASWPRWLLKVAPPQLGA